MAKRWQTLVSRAEEQRGEKVGAAWRSHRYPVRKQKESKRQGRRREGRRGKERRKRGEKKGEEKRGGREEREERRRGEERRLRPPWSSFI